MKKTLIAALLATSLPAFASQYFIVVPVPNKTVSNAAIDVSLSGYTLPSGLIGTPYDGFNLKTLLSVTGDPGYTGYGVQWAIVSGSLPAGLTLNRDGSITGTPTANGTASFQARATYKTKSGEQTYQIVVANLTVGLAAGAPPQALVGQGYSYDLTTLLSVTGDKAYTGAGVTWSVVSNSLPAGLYLTSDGHIGGAPTEAGSGAITVRATYKGVRGEQTYQVVSLKISAALAASTLPEAYLGRAYSFDLKPLLTVAGDPAFSNAAVSWSVVSSSLPAGLYMTRDGVIAGTPSAVGSGALTVMVVYRNAQGQQTYQVVSLDIKVALAAGAPPQAIVGQAYAYDLKQLLSVTGDQAYSGSGVTWTVVSSSLPAGLYLTNDGFIGGTPTAGGTGSLTARATYKNVNGEQTFQVVSLNLAVALAAGAPPQALVGQAYAYDLKSLLSVTGDQAYSGSGVTWSVVSSTLPAGLYLAADGTISGTPTAAGSGAVTARASYRNVKGEQTYQVVSLDIKVSLAQATMPAGVQGAAYSFDMKSLLSVTGDSAYTGSGVTWTLTSGTLPAGLSLSSSGIISGTPSAENTGTPFTIQAVYRTKMGQQTYAVMVGAITVSLGTITPPAGAIGVPYAGLDLKPGLTIQGDAAYAVGSGAGVTWSVVSGALPTNVSLNTSTGVIAGTPSARGTNPVQVKADYKGKSATQSFTISMSDSVKQFTGYRAWSDGTYAKSCKEYLNGKPGYVYQGATGDGIYRIVVPGYAPFDVVCDMTTSGGGWTVFQNRYNGAVDFYRTWAEYVNGFGTAQTEYWLGNDRLAVLTAGGSTLRIDLTRYTGESRYALYSVFKVNSASDLYRLSAGGYSGTAGDSFAAPQNGYVFSTYDADHDTWADNCAVVFHGAWWYQACHGSNLNGAYLNGPHSSYANGIEWSTWTGQYESLTKTSMKLREN